MTRHHHPYPCEQRFVRTARFKFAFNLLDTDELYDLETDPDEMVNQIDNPAYAAVREEMEARMWKHIQNLRDPIAGSFRTVAGKNRTQ